MDLNILGDWFRANKLSLNINKTTYMVFQNKREQPNSNMTINIGTESIKRETAVKFLGFIIEDQPHWTKHLKLCKSKMASSIYAMRSAKHVLSKDNIRTLYFALMYPYIDYGIILWGTAAKCHIYPLYVLQKKAIQIITDAKYNAHSSPLFKELKILNIQDIHLLNICKFMYDYHHSTLPNALSNIFQSNIDIHNHYTRQYTHHHIRSHRTALASKSIIHTGPKEWNMLPSSIKESNTKHVFTHRLKSHLIDKY